MACEVTIANTVEKHRPKFLELLEKLEDMWDGHLGRINTAKNRIELTHSDVRPIQSAPYRAGSRPRQFSGTEICRMLREDVLEPTRTERGSPIIFAPKKECSLRFGVDYHRLSKVAARDSYPLPLMNESINSLGEATIF